MLRAPFRGRRLQKPTEAQWDMRPWLRADGGANESMSLQLGITGILSKAGRISSVDGRSWGRISSVGGRISSVGTSVGSTIDPANVQTGGSIILCISV